MPIYVYDCNCGKQHEEFRSMKNLVATCPSCGNSNRPKPSLFSGKVVGNFTVIGHDGRVMSKKPYYDRTPYINPENGREY